MQRTDHSADEDELSTRVLERCQGLLEIGGYLNVRYVPLKGGICGEDW